MEEEDCNTQPCSPEPALEGGRETSKGRENEKREGGLGEEGGRRDFERKGEGGLGEEGGRGD